MWKFVKPWNCPATLKPPVPRLYDSWHRDTSSELAVFMVCWTKTALAKQISGRRRNQPRVVGKRGCLRTDSLSPLLTTWACTKTSINSPMSYENAYASASATLTPLRFLLIQGTCWLGLRNSGSRLRKPLMTQLFQLTQREVLEYAHHGIFYVFYTLRRLFQLETGFSTYRPQQHEKGWQKVAKIDCHPFSSPNWKIQPKPVRQAPPIRICIF